MQKDKLDYIFKSIFKNDPKAEDVGRIKESLSYYLSGYKKDSKLCIKPAALKEVNNDIIIIKDIKFSSLCKHHFLPIFGKIDIGYIPKNHVTGISGINRLVFAITKRLQLQEAICSQICNTMQDSLLPLGVIVQVTANHMCKMQEDEVQMHTLHKTGIFKSDAQIAKFLTMLNL